MCLMGEHEATYLHKAVLYGKLIQYNSDSRGSQTCIDVKEADVEVDGLAGDNVVPLII
jgi:hypothetical protein